MTQKLIFWTAFNTFRSGKLRRRLPAGHPHPVTTIEWTAQRFALWQQFTLKSILNQDYRDFLYVVLLDPYLQAMTDPLLPHLEDKRVVFSYNDAPLIRGLQDYDQLVLALIDSDDMYSHDAGTLMMTCRKQWMYFGVGYALDLKHKKLCSYNTRGSGPFYVERLPGSEFARFNRTKLHPEHRQVIKFKPALLPDYKFCMSIHSRNTSSTLNMPHVKKKTFGLKALRQFGIDPGAL